MRAAHSFWPGQATQHQRRTARQNIVLEDVGITAATLDRYYLAVERLLPALQGVCTEHELDDVISDWVQTEFEDGTPYSSGRRRSQWYSSLRTFYTETPSKKLEVVWDLAQVRDPLSRTAYYPRYLLGHGWLVRSSPRAGDGILAAIGVSLPASDR